MAIFTWPLQHEALRTSITINGVQTMANGTPTAAGWMQYGGVVGLFGLCGALGGLNFWFLRCRKHV